MCNQQALTLAKGSGVGSPIVYSDWPRNRGCGRAKKVEVVRDKNAGRGRRGCGSQVEPSRTFLLKFKTSAGAKIRYCSMVILYSTYSVKSLLSWERGI